MLVCSHERACGSFFSDDDLCKTDILLRKIMYYYE